MQRRRLKYLDPISSPCEGIGELKYRPQKSTFDASDREFLFCWVTGGIEKICLRHSSLFSNALTVIQNKTKQNKKKKKKKKKNNVVDDNFPLLLMTGNFCL